MFLYKLLNFLMTVIWLTSLLISQLPWVRCNYSCVSQKETFFFYSSFFSSPSPIKRVKGELYLMNEAILYTNLKTQLCLLFILLCIYIFVCFINSPSPQILSKPDRTRSAEYRRRWPFCAVFTRKLSYPELAINMIFTRWHAVMNGYCPLLPGNNSSTTLEWRFPAFGFNVYR